MFPAGMGVTPMTYLNRYRIKQAKTLLAAGDMNVTEVALAWVLQRGYFTRVFREERAYRRAPINAATPETRLTPLKKLTISRKGAKPPRKM
jgi:transcriptional regulator GlxA family with amidase domain